MTDYRISKARCEAGISGVCPGCGGEVIAMETEDNSGNPTYWSGCKHCAVFTHGVPPEIQRVARQMVEDGILVPWHHLKEADTDREYWLCGQTREAARILCRYEALKDGAQ